LARGDSEAEASGPQPVLEPCRRIALAGGDDDADCRVRAIVDGAQTLTEYKYLGLETFVEVDYLERPMAMARRCSAI